MKRASLGVERNRASPARCRPSVTSNRVASGRPVAWPLCREVPARSARNAKLCEWCAEEEARGWVPGPALSKAEEARRGCDFFSRPPDGGSPHPVEVKGWGEPLLGTSGEFTYDADINAAARSGVSRSKLAARDRRQPRRIPAGSGDTQRLTLTAADGLERSRPWRYKIRLTGLAARIRQRRRAECGAAARVATLRSTPLREKQRWRSVGAFAPLASALELAPISRPGRG